MGREQPLVNPLSCCGRSSPLDGLGLCWGSQVSSTCTAVRTEPLHAFRILHLSPLSVLVNLVQGSASGTGLVSHMQGEASVVSCVVAVGFICKTNFFCRQHIVESCFLTI